MRFLRPSDQQRAVLWFTPTACTLTEAECRVAVGISRGWSNARIATEHGVTVRTVANQVASVMKKMGASSRSEVAAKFGIGDMV